MPNFAEKSTPKNRAARSNAQSAGHSTVYTGITINSRSSNCGALDSYTNLQSRLRGEIYSLEHTFAIGLRHYDLAAKGSAVLVIELPGEVCTQIGRMQDYAFLKLTEVQFGT